MDLLKLKSLTLDKKYNEKKSRNISEHNSKLYNTKTNSYLDKYNNIVNINNKISYNELKKNTYKKNSFLDDINKTINYTLHTTKDSYIKKLPIKFNSINKNLFDTKKECIKIRKNKTYNKNDILSKSNFYTNLIELKKISFKQKKNCDVLADSIEKNNRHVSFNNKINKYNKEYNYNCLNNNDQVNINNNIINGSDYKISNIKRSKSNNNKAEEDYQYNFLYKNKKNDYESNYKKISSICRLKYFVENILHTINNIIDNNIETKFYIYNKDLKLISIILEDITKKLNKNISSFNKSNYIKLFKNNFEKNYNISELYKSINNSYNNLFLKNKDKLLKAINSNKNTINLQNIYNNMFYNNEKSTDNLLNNLTAVYSKNFDSYQDNNKCIRFLEVRNQENFSLKSDFRFCNIKKEYENEINSLKKEINILSIKNNNFKIDNNKIKLNINSLHLKNTSFNEKLNDLNIRYCYINKENENLINVNKDLELKYIELEKRYDKYIKEFENKLKIIKEFKVKIKVILLYN